MTFKLFERIELNEAVDYKPINDFSGKKYKLALIDNKTYKFKIDKTTYFIDVTPTMRGNMADNLYALSFDIYTHKRVAKQNMKSFDLISNDNVFKLTGTMEEIVDDVMTDLVGHGYGITEISQDYLIEPGESKNVRSIIFNRPILNVLRKHKIQYEKTEEIKTSKNIFEVRFIFAKPFKTIIM